MRCEAVLCRLGQVWWHGGLTDRKYENIEATTPVRGEMYEIKQSYIMHNHTAPDTDTVRMSGYRRKTESITTLLFMNPPTPPLP